MSDVVLEVDGTSKRFRGRLAVDRVTLAVRRGDLFGLLGHNGAGKSTLIGMMLGQVWPTAGVVRIHGHDVARDRRRALARVGAIFESPAFYEELSGWRNLEILSAYTARTPAARIREVLDWVGLSGRERSAVRTYSHGMRARLALGQALLPAPELLILDEPGDGLDPEGIHELRETLLRLRRELGLTLLLSSHLLAEVEQLCNRILVLHQGRKVFDGTIEETRRHGRWLGVRTDDFEAAAAELATAGLVTGTRDGRWVMLSEGVGAESVVRRLVERGRPVYEAVPDHTSLEAFYLELMHREAPSGAGAVSETRGSEAPC
ncbi:MAG: ABC transporter ATP-binding protein [Verrucomicrobiales bacterium]|nr:ABC transporter ATP-binding protein [Verrucomicrobiales bacterium]